MQGRPTRSDTHHPASPLSPTLSNPYPAHAILPRMTGSSDLISHGLREASLALTNVIGMTNIHLKPLTLPRSLARRASGRLKQLEVIVRRLLTLMALALELAPVRPRLTPATPAPLPEGTEIATFPSPRRFALSARIPSGHDWSVDGLALDRQRTGPVPAAPFLARVSALYKVLEAPDLYAQRLARSLARQQKRGDPKPVALPMASAYRLRPELGMIATALPGLLSAALEKWDNSS